jgi:hypothetical protein
MGLAVDAGSARASPRRFVSPAAAPGQRLQLLQLAAADHGGRMKRRPALRDGRRNRQAQGARQAVQLGQRSRERPVLDALHLHRDQHRAQRLGFLFEQKRHGQRSIGDAGDFTLDFLNRALPHHRGND